MLQQHQPFEIIFNILNYFYKNKIAFDTEFKHLIPKRKFYKRILIHTIGDFGVVVISLLIGTLGYFYTEKLSWLDSLLNASMILGGMGTVNEIHSYGKIFASFYTLFSSIGFLVIMEFSTYILNIFDYHN